MFCGKVVPIVNGLAKQYEGKMQFSVVDKGTGDSLARIEKYGFDQHGMVITDQDDAVVWKEEGHKQTEAGVRAAIDKALAE